MYASNVPSLKYGRMTEAGGKIECRGKCIAWLNESEPELAAGWTPRADLTSCWISPRLWDYRGRYFVHAHPGMKTMRESDGMRKALFMVVKLEDFVAIDHPLRPIRDSVNEAQGAERLVQPHLADMSCALIASQMLLRAMLRRCPRWMRCREDLLKRSLRTRRATRTISCRRAASGASRCTCLTSLHCPVIAQACLVQFPLEVET